ncbi:hypothetical protein R5R35_014134 [Gryllus longicercus]|uniref:Uncharacterized protein n=1 Tax=Gryllus longicercus TaxID=2509291 RepID=A0AAN9VCR6_9ORTH
MPRRHSLKSRKCKTPNDLSSTSITEGRSILKKRQRKPLQEVVDLHLTADTKPQTNTRSNNRRVSFAVSEVKEFRQPANEGTLWGSSYFVDIQKSSSESENTESSASTFQTSSGSCGSGLIYSQQVIVQETVSVSYSDIDECQEFREDNLSDVQSNRVCELIDAANQTDESVFQFLNNSRDPTKKSDVCREVVPTYLQHVNNGRKFMDPSEMLGEFLQLKPNFPQTIPCETFERQTPTTLPYSSVSTEREFDKENSSLPMNTKNKDHASIFSEPSGISQKHPLTLCDDSFEIAKKQEIGIHCNDIKLLDWLREEKPAAVREQQKPIWINNQLGVSNELKNLKHSHDHVEYDMQDCPHISKQSLKNENEVLNNSSGDMSFTLSNAPLLNISCTNKDSSTGTSCNNSEYSGIDPGTKNLNSEKTQMLSDYNNEPVEKERLSISPKASEACFIEKNMASSSRGKRIDNEVSSHKDKYSDVCLKRMSPNEVEGGKNSCTNNSIASNHSTGFENVTSSVSPTMVNGRILGNIQLSNQFPNCENVTRNISSTVPDEIDLIGAAPVSNLDNISGVSLTMTAGKILDNHCISRHKPALAFKRIGSQIVSSERVFNNVEDATQNFINIGSNCESTVSPITTEDLILCNSQSSRLRDVSGNKSPTIPVRQTLYDNASFYSGCPINVRNKLPRMVGEKIDTGVLPAGHFEKCLNDNFTVLSHVPYFQDTIPTYSCPTNPQERVFSNVSCKNYNCSLGNLEGSEFLTESGESISDKKEISHHYCDFRNASRLVSPTMPAERNLDKIHIADENSDLVNDSRSVSPTMPMGRIISQGQSSSHTNCKGIIAISTSPALPAGRNLDKINRTDETSEWVNASSVSPTVSMGRIIGEGQSNPYTTYKDISAVSVSPTLPAGRILDKINRTDETSEWVNASRSVSPTVPMGRIIDEGQSSPYTNYKDISAVSVSSTLPAGRILDKINGTDETSEWVNASRSVSPTVPMGRLIGEGQSSPFTNYKNTSAVSVSPTLPAGRILDKINRTHETSELVNVSRSVSPTMSMGRIIGEDQSSPHTNCKDISGISVSLTLPAGRILDKFQTTHQNSDFVNASRSVSPTMPVGRIIGQGQSSQNADGKDISEISASPTLQAGRILEKIIKTDEPSDFVNARRSVSPTMSIGRIIGQGQSSQNADGKDISEISASPTLQAGRISGKIIKTDEPSDFVNARRSVSPTMTIGRIISQGQSSQNAVGKDISEISASPTLQAGRFLGRIIKTNEPSDFANASRSVSPTMPVGRIIGQGQTGQNTGCKDNSEASASTLCAGKIVEKIHESSEASDLANISRGRFPTMPMGRIIGEMNTSKNRGFEVTHRRSVSPTTPLGRVFHNNQISCDNVELACKVVKENMAEQGDFSNCPSLKLTSERDLESTSPLQEHNPDKLSKSSNENVPPSISKGYIAMCDKHVSLTETLEKMCIDEKYAVEGFIENDKEFLHHNPRKQVEIIFNAQGTSTVVDTNVFHKTCNTNNSLVATDCNVLKETQDHSDCKNVKIGFYNSKTRMADTDNKNLGEFVRMGKDTVDKIERTSFNLNEDNTDLPVIRINDISMDFSENTGSINNPAAVIWKRNTVESVELNIEKDFIEQKKGGNSLFSTTDYRNCSNIKLKEVSNIEENCDDSERTNIDMNSDSKMNVGECFVNSQIVCNMKSTEKENDTRYSNSSTSSKVECEGSNNAGFCETNNPGGLMNNGSQTNCKNTNVICIDDKRDNEEVMPCSDARDEDSEGVESDIELNIVSSPVKFHISKDNSFSSEAIEVDNTFRSNGEIIRNVKSAKDLVVSTNECTDEKNYSCNEKTNIHINKEETNEENKHSKIVETVSKSNRPSICVSGIDYIDWKSSLDVTNAMVNSNNKSRPVKIFPGTQSPHFLIPESSISIVETRDNNYSSEIERSDCSESSLISPSNFHDNEFDGANDILIKSFRDQGRNDLLKERSASSFSFHNEKSKSRIIETPCRIGIEVNSNKLKIPQYVQPVSKLMNVDEKPTTNTVEIGISVSENKPPILGVSPVQLEDDRSVNSSTGHLRSMPSDILQPQDFIERVSSSNSPGTSAQTDIVIHDEMIKDVKKTVELPSNTNEENKTKMQEIHPHTYCSKSTDSVICIGAKNDFVLNESNTIKEDIKMNIELLADIQGNKLEMKEVHTRTPSKTFAPIMCTHAKNDIVINESKSFKGNIENKIELPTGVQVNEAEIHSCVPSKSTAQINFSDAESEIVINENKTINGDVKRNIELPTGIQVNKKEMKEIHPHKPSKRSAQINSNDEQWSPLQKKTRFSPPVAPNLPTRLSYYESFFSKENQTPTSTSFKRNYSYAFGYKSTTNDLSSQVIPPLSFERWIQEQSKKCNWKVEHISSSKINFFFLEKKVKVYVEIDPSNLNLSKIDVKSHLKGNNTAIFLHNLFLKRLKLDTLKVRFPSKNDIPALIDFISTEEEFILDFAQDWLDLEIRQAIQMKENFCAEFEVTSLLLSWLCIIKIDLSSWNGERLHSRYIQVCPVIGEINDAEIKRLIRAIPGGPHLLKDYVSHLHNYIHTKEKFEGKGSFLAE